MKVYVIGDHDDVAGFALTGIEPLPDEFDPAETVVIASAEAAEDAMRKATAFVVVLPEP